MITTEQHNTTTIAPASSVAEVRRVFDAAFPRESRAWTDWFFREVFRPDEALVQYVSTDGKETAASALMMMPYQFSYQGVILGMSYIYGAGTMPRFRGRGLMHGLMEDALRRSHLAGDALCALVPAERRLYFFYDKFGFETVFYDDEERYTSLHRFSLPAGVTYSPLEVEYGLLHRLESHLPAAVIHSHKQFEYLMEDLEQDGGIALGVRVDDTDDCAVLMARSDSHAVTVLMALADSETAYQCALDSLRRTVGEKQIIVRRTPVGASRTRLRSHGMMRIVSAEQVLGVMAARNPRMRMTIRLHDDIIADNDAIFLIRDGVCTRKEVEHNSCRYDLDVSIDVLAGILFSAPRVGEIFNLPTCRPTMAMMLD